MKRVVDLCGALIGILLFSPIMLVLYVLIRRDMGTPVLFHQMRPGLHGKPFKMIKFRSMRESGKTDAERLTPLGAKLRSSSLDELPGFWNVLKGQMSLVGPRPLLMEYLPLYSSQQARRHEVRPGLTGWAQVNGRNGLSWDEKFALDVWYVDNQSFWLDLKILSMTVRKVISRDGISADGEATMAKFTGDK
jgi:lipopolysaccharide/colanic/teichoic acid biosynthesis glycosyltransferase